MEGELVWQGGVKFDAATGSGHTVVIDGAVEGGGTNAGARPMELVLLGVASCASYDVVTILKKQRQDVTRCVVRVEAERAPEPPRVFTKIHMHFDIAGEGLTESKVARAVKLSAETYCSASIMLKRGGVEIEHSYAVEGAKS